MCSHHLGTREHGKDQREPNPRHPDVCGPGGAGGMSPRGMVGVQGPWGRAAAGSFRGVKGEIVGQLVAQG